MKNKNKLSYSEYCKLDTIKSSIPIAKLLKEQRIKEYNKNPKCCLYCNAPISYERKSAKFCNSSCAAKYNNHNRVVTEAHKEKTSKTMKSKPLREVKCCRCGNITYTNSTCKTRRILCDNCRDTKNRPKCPKHRKRRETNTSSKYRKPCKWCGAKRGQCKHPEICKLHQVITRSLIPNFEFDSSTIGTERIYEEFIRVKDMLYDLYWNQQLSLQEIKDKFPKCKKELSALRLMLIAIGIQTRTPKQAVNNFIKQHPDRAINQYELNKNYQFKSGWHTTWNNKQIFYRSSDELNFALQLDEKKINYEVEKVRIFYYDTQKQCERLAIVDFYLPDTNEIFEIKGYMWYNETTKQNMRDKFAAYKKAGYIPHLIVNNSEIVSF
jgi:hypothetical protein